MIRILHIVTHMNRGGLETMIMNYYRNIDRNKVQFDFLVHRTERADYDDEIEDLGGTIYRLPSLNPFSKIYLNRLDDFFKNHRKKYKIIHCHLDCMSGIPLKYAKKYGIPVRIAHSHNSNQNKDAKYILKLIYKNNIHKYANNFFACSALAGKWMFKKIDLENIVIMNNAIDSTRYIYNLEKRINIRDSFGIPENALVIGHIGRFNKQKNHDFLIDIFYHIYKKDNCARLLLVGDGELKETIYQKVNDMGILDKVIFTGVRDDIPDLLQGMDVFLFPSLFEGLGIAVVEAQASGLPCIISDSIPDECNMVNDLVIKLNLKDPISEWADTIINVSKQINRVDTSKKICDAGYDIKETAKWLEDFYLEKYKNKTNDIYTDL